MIKELNRNAMYYRGLENLTYNEIIEKKNKNLKWMLKWSVYVTVASIMFLIVSMIAPADNDLKQGFYYGFCFFFWFFMMIDIFVTSLNYNKIYNLRIKEIEG